MCACVSEQKQLTLKNVFLIKHMEEMKPRKISPEAEAWNFDFKRHTDYVLSLKTLPKTIPSRIKLNQNATSNCILEGRGKIVHINH